LTFDLTDGTLTGTSTATYNNVIALTSDSDNYDVTYTVTTDTWQYLATYAISGQLSGTTVSSTGAVILTATSDVRDVTLIVVKADNMFTMVEKQDNTDTLTGGTLTLTGVAADIQSFITEYESSLVEVIRSNIMSQYDVAENALLAYDIANTAPSTNGVKASSDVQE